MTGAMLTYVAVVDRMNRWIGRIVMYGIFVMMAILLWSSFTKLGSDIGLDINPSLWTLEMAQFAMVAYYILGGPYSIQMGSNVRMDLLYGEWSDRHKAQVDAIDQVRALLDVPSVHTIGYCVAGTTLAATLAFAGALADRELREWNPVINIWA